MLRYPSTYVIVAFFCTEAVVTVHAQPQPAGREASAAVEARRHETAQKEELAEALLAERERSMGRNLAAGYRSSLKGSLATLPLEKLESLAAAPSEVDLRAALGEPSSVLGATGTDLVYTPVTPCRVFDTRFATSGIMVGGSQRNFLVAGATTNFGGQGGNVLGCNIPLGPATAVMLNFTAVAPTGSGNLRAWAVSNPQTPAPGAAVMNYSTTLAALANGIAVPICDPAATSCAAGDLRLQADLKSVHVVGDVVGFFSKVDGSFLTRAMNGVTTVLSPTTPTSANLLTGVIAPVAGGLLVNSSFRCDGFGTLTTAWSVGVSVDGTLMGGIDLYFPAAGGNRVPAGGSLPFFHPVAAGTHTVSFNAERVEGNGNLDCYMHTTSQFVRYGNTGGTP